MSQLTKARAESGEKADDFSCPEFLTSQYFEKILKKFNNDSSLKVATIKVEPFGSDSDGFASTMYRVEVSAKQNGDDTLKRGSYIVKMMPKLKIAVDKLGEGSYNVQQKEMDIFQNVFPELSRILKSIGEDKNIFPQAIAVDRKREVLLLEDLAVKKFEMVDRKVGMDMVHLKLGLDKLARFHAASMVLMQESPNVFDQFDVGMFSRKTSAFNDFFSGNMNALTAEVSSWKGFEVYGKKLEKLKTKMYERAFQVFDNDDGDLKVFIHGDLWINNFMFLHGKNGEVKDAIMVSVMRMCHALEKKSVWFFSASYLTLKKKKT